MAQPDRKPLNSTCIYASSEDENFPASELTHRAGGPHARLRGWQSSKFSDYPQELGFRLDGECGLSQLQILAHQSKTPTRVDVFTCSLTENGLGAQHAIPYHQATWKRLGFLTFSSNEKSKYKSRERKTVPLDTGAFYVKLVIHKNHPNTVNVYNQVSLITVAVSGDLHFPVHHVPQTDPNLVLPPVRAPNAHHNAIDASPRPHDHNQQNNYQQADDEENVYAMISGNAPPPAPPNFATPHSAQQKQNRKGVLPPIKPQGLPPQSKSPNSYPSSQTPNKHNQQHDAYHANLTYNPPSALPPIQQQPSSYDPYGGHNAAPPQQHRPEGELGGLINYRSQRMLEFEGFYTHRSKDLSLAKAHAIQVEDFDQAKAAKEQLTYLLQVADRVYELEGNKVRNIYDEDFLAANAAKEEMDMLTGQCIAALNACAQGVPLNDAVREAQRNAGPANGGRHHQRKQNNKVSPLDPSVVGSNNGGNGAAPSNHASNQNTPGYGLGSQQSDANDGARNSFEDQPVQSKYAQMMAEQAEQKRLEKERKRQQQQTEDDEDDEHADGDDQQEAKRRKQQPKPTTRADDDDEQEDDEEDADHQDEENNEEEEEEAEENDDDSDEEATPKRKPPPKKKPSPKRRRSHHSDANDDDNDNDGQDVDPNDDNGLLGSENRAQFDIETFEEWERDVYFAIQDETGKETPEQPADPLDSSISVPVDVSSALGQYTTACLFSRRWKLRDAAIKVVSQFFSLYYTKHATPLNIVIGMLKYLDIKGFGLLDPIQTVFFSAAEFVARVLDGRFEGASLSTVQVHVVNLLPRIVLRGGDTTAKTREEALSLIFALAESPIGSERVAMAMLAEPIDHDKRRMNSVPVKIHLARLMVMQQMMTNYGLGSKISVDNLMTRLCVPCLNNGNVEVRDLAVVVVGCIDPARGPDVMRYMPQIKNPNTRAVIEEKLAHPDGDAVSPTPPPAESNTPKPAKPKKKK